MLIRGLGPIPAFRTAGAAMGTCTASGILALYSIVKLWRGGWVVSFPRGGSYAPDWTIIKSIFRFGLPTGIQGIAMNVGGVFMLAFIGSLAQSAAAQAAFAVSYSQLFSLITWTSVGLMGAAAAVAGQNLGARQPERAEEAVHVAAQVAATVAVFVGICFFFFGRQLLAVFGMHEPAVVDIGTQLLPRVERVGTLHCRGAHVHRRTSGNRRHQRAALHLGGLAGGYPAWDMLHDSAVWDAPADSHLDRDSDRACDAVRAERYSVQPGEVEGHRGRYQRGKIY